MIILLILSKNITEGDKINTFSAKKDVSARDIAFYVLCVKVTKTNRKVVNS